jgi:outer membrane receptor protein involved in Fe transport
VPGTFVREATDFGIHYAGYTNNIPGPANATNSANNFKLAKNDINPVRYEGFRGEALLKFNDDWNALLSESFQQMHAEGVFYEEPYTSGSAPVKLPPLSVQTFEPSFDQDSFENTGLTINGRLGVLNLVYDGAYLVRHVTQQQDYTNYARGVYGDYYQCQPANPAKGTAAKCYSPAATWNSNEADSHLSQEIRLSTPDTWRLRAIGGFYYENFKVVENTNFNYLTDTGNFTPIGPAPGSEASEPGIRSPNTGFFTDAQRGYTQYAIFGSADFDIIPKVLTATVGTRWFDFIDYEKGFVGSSFYCSQAAYTGPAPCIGAASHNLTALGLQNRAYGFKSRANLTYKITPDILVYYTWSQGYRPGGYNRTEIKGVGGYFFASDTLTNNEVGYKASFFDHRLILDGAFYDERWDNVQAEVFDPGVFGNLSFVTNGPSFRVLGTELQATGRPTDDLTLNANVALNSSKQTTTPLFEGTPLFGANGTLAQSPAFKTSFRARYEWTESTYAPFVQLSLTHSSHSHSAAAGDLITLSPDFYLEKPIYNFLQEPITKLDLSAGMSYGPWSGSVYIDNVTNERGQNFISATQFVQSVIVDRPLTAGVKLAYRF